CLSGTFSIAVCEFSFLLFFSVVLFDYRISLQTSYLVLKAQCLSSPALAGLKNCLDLPGFFRGLTLWPHADLYHVHLPALLQTGCCPLGHYQEQIFANGDVIFLLRRLVGAQDGWLHLLG